MKLLLVVCYMLAGLNSGACLNYYLLDERGRGHDGELIEISYEGISAKE